MSKRGSTWASRPTPFTVQAIRLKGRHLRPPSTGWIRRRGFWRTSPTRPNVWPTAVVGLHMHLQLRRTRRPALRQVGRVGAMNPLLHPVRRFSEAGSLFAEFGGAVDPLHGGERGIPLHLHPGSGSTTDLRGVAQNGPLQGDGDLRRRGMAIEGTPTQAVISCQNRTHGDGGTPGARSRAVYASSSSPRTGSCLPTRGTCWRRRRS
jgi:hypothetical protein